MDDISPLIAFAGGLLSLLSPCMLPMIPVYIASLSGPEIFESGIAGRRLFVFRHSLSFVVGFSVIFILLGAGAGIAGLSLSSHVELFRQISGSIMIIFGLFMLAAPGISWLNYEKRLAPSQSIRSGYLRSFIIGIIFSLAWTPCVGPVLGGILTLALNSQSGWTGAYLLTIYSIGLGVPFLLIGLVFDSALPWLKRVNRYSKYIYLVSGVLLIAVGILIILNKLSWFSYSFAVQ
jgi:cytochrome c-type biogenesis protein